MIIKYGFKKFYDAVNQTELQHVFLDQPHFQSARIRAQKRRAAQAKRGKI